MNNTCITCIQIYTISSMAQVSTDYLTSDLIISVDKKDYMGASPRYTVCYVTLILTLTLPKAAFHCMSAKQLYLVH